MDAGKIFSDHLNFSEAIVNMALVTKEIEAPPKKKHR